MPTKPLPLSTVRSRLRRELPGWRLVGGKRLRRSLKFRNFRAAMRYVNRVAREAESYGHHPDILVYDWNRVRIDLTTHDAGWRVSRYDFAMARLLDRIPT